jgi:hypothetical protein
MIKRIATVGGLTLVSRVTGFIRDVVMAAVLGAGPVADAFFVAFRLPNHLRAIVAEGAFNAAFVPAYARTLAIYGGSGLCIECQGDGSGPPIWGNPIQSQIDERVSPSLQCS